MYEYLSTSIYNWIGYLWTGGVNNVNNITSNLEVSTSKDNPFLGIYNHFLLETEMLERSDVLKILSQNKNYQILQISIPKYYSSYLFCQIVFDILDILSNELFFVQTQIQFVFDTETKDLFIEEYKEYIRKNIPFLQRNRVLPVYIKFYKNPSFHIDYTITLDQRFHILFMKENEETISIQRIYFLIDL